VPRAALWIRAASAAAALAAGYPLTAQQQPPPVGFGRAVGQTAAGFFGMAAGFVGTGLATRWAAKHWFKASDDRASSVAMGGAYIGGLLGAAAGPTIVGAGPGPRGTYWVLGCARGRNGRRRRQLPSRAPESRRGPGHHPPHHLDRRGRDAPGDRRDGGV
jgi:hypothetical protein